MRDFAVGCGFIIVIAIIVSVALAVMCGPPDDDDEVTAPRSTSATDKTATPLPKSTPTPRPQPTSTPPPAVNAMDVYYEYLDNEPRANQVYKRRWLTVTLNDIDPIEDGGKVVRWINPGERIQLDFKNERDVLRLDPGDDVTAVCKLAGKETQWLAGGFVVRFFDCRLVATPKPTPTAVPTPSLERYSCETLAEAAQFSSRNHYPDSYIVSVLGLKTVKQTPDIKECEAQVELSKGEFKHMLIRAVLEGGAVRTGYELSEIE